MRFWKLAGFVALAELLGAVGAVFTAPKIGTWYAGLIKPPFSPPDWLFAPVWTALFALIGIALYLIWESPKRRDRQAALAVFWLQLGLNVLWTPLFFGLQSPLLGLVDILFLWLAILFTLLAARKVSRPAFWLLLPYILWVSFAAALNFAIWILN